MESDLTTKIKALNLVDIVRGQTDTELRRAGGKFVGRCPLHEEKAPSFTVFADNRFYCFGCGARGDSVDFIRALHGCDFKTAIKILGIEPGKLSKVDFEAIRAREARIEAARKAKERETAVAFTLAHRIRSAYKALADITPENLDEYAGVLDKLDHWKYLHEILCTGTDKDKLAVCEELKDMKIVRRNTAFKPGFDLGAWSKRLING